MVGVNGVADVVVVGSTSTVGDPVPVVTGGGGGAVPVVVGGGTVPVVVVGGGTITPVVVVGGVGTVPVVGVGGGTVPVVVVVAGGSITPEVVVVESGSNTARGGDCSRVGSPPPRTSGRAPVTGWKNGPDSGPPAASMTGVPPTAGRTPAGVDRGAAARGSGPRATTGGTTC